MKNNFLETLSQIFFLGLFSVLVILTSLGITQDFTKIKTVEFWTEVSVRLTITIILFNIIYYMDKRNRMHDTSSRFYISYATNRLKVKEIEKKELYSALDEAVEKENKEMLEEQCNQLLHKYCTRVSYDIAISNKEISEILEEYKVLNKRRKKLTALILKIRAGAIKLKHYVKADYFLNDKELAKIKSASYDYSELALSIQRNAIKAFTFTICSVFIATLSFSLVSVDFWTTFVTNFTLFLGAMVSGFASSYKDIKLKTAIYEKRNRFILKRLKISVEYIAEE